MEKDLKNEFKVKGEELLAKLKELVHAGNVKRIVIKDDTGKVYLEIPVTVGVVGLVLAPVWAAVGALAALAAKFTIEVIRRDDAEAEDTPDTPEVEEKTEEADEE